MILAAIILEEHRRDKKRAKGQCVRPRCMRAPRKLGLYCNTCNSRDQDARHPERRCYRNLKISAERRGHLFELTFEEFEKFAIETQYLNRRGNSAKGYTVDRIDSKLGYTLDNLQILTNRENGRKARVEQIYGDYVPPENENEPF